MKRLIAIMLAMALCLGVGMGFAENVEVPEVDAIPASEEAAKYDEFVIGATTRLSGMFFTSMWGNNTADIDVRSLVHAYSPVNWTQQSLFEMNPQVVDVLEVGPYVEGRNKTYRITLHDDLVYSDGTPIRAADYVFSMMLYASPVIRELGGITTNSGHIVGYDAYASGETDVFSGLRIVNDLTFTIEIRGEFLPFFYEYGMLDAIPYPISVIAPGCEVVDEGAGARIRNIDQSVTEPLFTAELLQKTVLDPETGYRSHPTVSSGPYKLTSFDWETREATFEINEYFKGTYDGAVPTIDNLRLKAVTPGTMMDEFAQGDVQLLNKVVAGENIDEGLAMMMEGTASSSNYPRMGFGFLSFACEEGQGPFESEAVREAVAYAIDVPAYTQAYSAQYALPVYGYMGIGQWMYLVIEQDGVPGIAQTEEEVAEWEALTLENLNTYEVDLEKAKRLLAQDGWTLNAEGNAFVEGTDKIRYKKGDDGLLEGLIVKWAKMQDSLAAEILGDMMIEPLAQIGMEVEITELPFTELLEHYYRQKERTYDMFYLATNFVSIFDPYFMFNTADEYQGTQNTTGLRDEHLQQLAKELRETEPGALLEYCEKWVVLQEYWNDKLPMLPLYSNIYFDFFVTDLQNYAPNAEMNWPMAIVYGYTTDAKPQWLLDKEALEPDEALDGDGEDLLTIENIG